MAVAYEDRFVEFNKQYANKGVKFVAINANRRTEDLAAMKTRADQLLAQVLKEGLQTMLTFPRR